MIADAVRPHPQAVDYFSVLARARHLLPEARAVLDHTTLVDPNVIHEAAGMCDMKPEWKSFDPDDVSHLMRMLGSIQGDVYVAGDAITDHHLRVFQHPYAQLTSLQCEIELGHVDAVLLGVTDPVIAVVHHDALCTALRCPLPHGLPEDPRELERHLLEQVEQRRRGALEQIPAPVLRGVLAILEDDNSYVPALKYIAAELMCSLAEAGRIVRLLKPWWPGKFTAPTAVRINETRLRGEHW